MEIILDVFGEDSAVAHERYLSAVEFAREWGRSLQVGCCTVLPDGSIWRDGKLLLPPQRFQVTLLRHRHTQRRYVVLRSQQPWLAAFVADDEAAAPYLAGRSLPSDAALGEAIRLTRAAYDDVTEGL